MNIQAKITVEEQPAADCRAVGFVASERDLPVKLTKTERRIFALLATHHPRRFFCHEIADAIYGDCENGGPMSADMAVRTAIHRLRKKLDGTKYRVPKSRGEGFQGVSLEICK